MKTLYRPIGEKELILITENDFKKFPPRLSWQPIFYPVLNEQYAIEIASKWNTKDEFGNYLGFVTAFEITEEEFSKHKIQNVGGKHHNELWVPAEKLNEFNDAIVGRIRIINLFVGEKFEKFTTDEVVDSIILETDIYKTRLDHYLETKSREIIPFSEFDADFLEEKDADDKTEDDLNILKEEASKINSVDEVVDFLIEKVLSKKSIENIQNQTPLKPLKLNLGNHFGMGMFLRNWFFYPENKKLMNSINEYESVNAMYGERGEGIIENALWRRLNHCEVSKSPNKEKFEIMQKNIDDFYGNFFMKKGLVREKMTLDQFDEIRDELLESIKKNNISDLEERLKLLSYNLSDSQIENYLSISKKNETTRGYNFEEAIILSNLKEEDMPVFIKLKDVYVNTLKVAETILKLLDET